MNPLTSCKRVFYSTFLDSQENLKYLLDLAEQEAINRFTTAEIKVDMSGMQNMVNNTNDLDSIVEGLSTRVIGSMEVVREGCKKLLTDDEKKCIIFS